MERLTTSPAPALQSYKLEASVTIIRATLAPPLKEDAAEVQFDLTSLSLSLSAEEILSRINNEIGKSRPDLLAALPSQEEATPEATASWVVRGITALYPQYRAERSDLSEAEVLAQFMTAVRSGVQKGFEDAAGILEALGALNLDGVKEAVDTTMSLIEKQLKDFEQLILGEARAPQSPDTPSEVVGEHPSPLREHLEVVA